MKDMIGPGIAAGIFLAVIVTALSCGYGHDRVNLQGGYFETQMMGEPVTCAAVATPAGNDRGYLCVPR